MCLVFMVDTKGVVYKFQALNLNLNLIEYLRFIFCYEKVNRERMLWQSETWLDIYCLLVGQQKKVYIWRRQYLKFQSSVL